MSLIPLNEWSTRFLAERPNFCNFSINHGTCTNKNCTRDHLDLYTDTPFTRENYRQLIGKSAESSPKLRNYLEDMLLAGIRTFDISQLVNKQSQRYDNLNIYKTVLRDLCNEHNISFETIEFVKNSINLTWTGLIDLNTEPKNNLIIMQESGDIYQSDTEIIEARRYAAAANANFPIHNKH